MITLALTQVLVFAVAHFSGFHQTRITVSDVFNNEVFRNALTIYTMQLYCVDEKAKDVKRCHSPPYL